MSPPVTPVRLLRVVGVLILLLGLYHLSAIAFMTPLGRSQLLFTYIVFGFVLSVVGIWLLRGDLATLFRPSRYDVVFGLVAFVVLAYYSSWILGKSFWQLIAQKSPLPVAHMYTVTGIGFVLTFALASCGCIVHFVVLLFPRFRRRLQPQLLSHLAALLLLLPSLRLGSQLPTIRSFFQHTTKTSNQALQPTAGRCELHV